MILPPFPLNHLGIITRMVSRLYTPLASFAGGMLIGAYYSDDLRASANLASNRVSWAEL